MGTRHLVAVVHKKKIKVAQYGQWDGYLSGQGNTIVKFIQSKLDLKKFRKAVEECRFMDETESKKKYVECGFSEEGWGNMEAGDNLREKYPELSRDTGAEILFLIQNKNKRELQNAIDFAADSLFCEYAYVLDLDNKVLEIYKGFNKGKSKGRFSKMAKHKNQDGSESEYSPVNLVKKLTFRQATAAALKKLDKELYPKDEE